jgi:hypothetical protein
MQRPDDSSMQNALSKQHWPVGQSASDMHVAPPPLLALLTTLLEA